MTLFVVLHVVDALLSPIVLPALPREGLLRHARFNPKQSVVKIRQWHALSSRNFELKKRTSCTPFSTEVQMVELVAEYDV